VTGREFSDDEIAREFEGMVQAGELREPSTGDAYATAKRSGFARGANGVWIATETGESLDAASAARIESLWRDWAPRLPDAVRRAIDGGSGGDGDGAGDREPRIVPPSAPIQARSLPTPDDAD
jgi:hypothetical protein